MLKYLSQHALAYFFLILMLLLHGIAYLLIQEPRLQFVVVISAACVYVAWGMVHHALERTLMRHVVLEYAMISLLAIAIGYVLLATR